MRLRGVALAVLVMAPLPERPLRHTYAWAVVVITLGALDFQG